MQRKRESQQLCGRPKCKNHFAALKAHFSLGRYHRSSHALDASRNPTKPRTFSPLKGDRAWRQVAGPTVDVCLATIWADDAVKHANRTNRKYWSDAGESAEIQRHHEPVNIVGGFKWPNAPVVDLGLRPYVCAEPYRPSPSPTEEDPLAIPEFLIRFETAAPSDTTDDSLVKAG
jgi:hypothetical protein